jgi:hypothetical protein
MTEGFAGKVALDARRVHDGYRAMADRESTSVMVTP